MNNDLISRAALKDTLDGVVKGYIADKSFQSNFAAAVVREIMDNEVESAPTVDPVRHGRWIDKVFPAPLSDSMIKKVQCSECQTHWDARTNYCPNCGAKMDGGENNAAD